MKLPEFILAHNRTELGTPVIVQTRTPFLIAKIRLDKNEDDFAAWTSTSNEHKHIIEGYNVAVYVAGVLPGVIMVHPINYTDILRRMAEFYKTERLEYKPGFYKKYAK